MNTHESEDRHYRTTGHHVRQTAEFNSQGGRTLNKSRLGRKNSLKGCTEDLFGKQGFGLDLTHEAVQVILQ